MISVEICHLSLAISTRLAKLIALAKQKLAQNMMSLTVLRF